MPYVLGLLQRQEARDLVTLPMEHTLGEPTVGDLDLILELTGKHPAFIQMVMAAVWFAAQGKYPVDRQRLDNGLLGYYQDLLAPKNRSPEELELLRRAARGQDVKNGIVLNRLQQRGLLTLEGQPFSPVFAEILRQGSQKSFNFNAWVDQLDRALSGNAKRLGSFEKIIAILVKLRRRFAGSDTPKAQE